MTATRQLPESDTTRWGCFSHPCLHLGFDEATVRVTAHTEASAQLELSLNTFPCRLQHPVLRDESLQIGLLLRTFANSYPCCAGT